MMKNKANGQRDSLVTELMPNLPMKAVYEVAHWFAKRFNGECLAPVAKLERGLRGFRAIALLSVFSQWYTKVLVDLLRVEEFARWGRERSQLRAHGGVTDEKSHTHWEWQQPGFSR